MENNGKAFLHTLMAAAWVPLAQTIITFIIVTMAAIFFSSVLNVRHWLAWSIGIGLLAAVGWWIYSLRHWFNLTRLEIATGIDLNGDSYVGEPPSERAEPHVKVTLNRISDNGHFSGEYFDLPGTLDTLKQLADGLLNGAPFTEREWCGAGKPFSTTAFRDLRRELMRRGLVELASEKDARQGYVLTDEGSQFMSDILDNQESK